MSSVASRSFLADARAIRGAEIATTQAGLGQGRRPAFENFSVIGM